MILIWKGRPVEMYGEVSIIEEYRDYLRNQTHCEKRVHMYIQWMLQYSILYRN